MINYLEKYNALPKDLRDKISAPRVMEAIHDMENRYSVNLAGIVMRVVVRDLKVDELKNFFIYTIGISSEKAEGVVRELKEKVFSEVSNYIDYINQDENEKNKEDDLSGIPFASQEKENSPNEIKIEQNTSHGADFYFSIEDEDEVRSQARDFSKLDTREQVARQVEAKINNIIGEINVIFSSEDMLHRLKRILQTYLRGVRDKVDTKLVLERKIENGGLELDDDVADDILKIVDVVNKDEKGHPGRVVKPRKFPVLEDKQILEGQSGVQSSLGGDVDYDFSKLDKTIKVDKNKIDDNHQSVFREEKEVCDKENLPKVDSTDVQEEIDKKAGKRMTIDDSQDKNKKDEKKTDQVEEEKEQDNSPDLKVSGKKKSKKNDSLVLNLANSSYKEEDGDEKKNHSQEHLEKKEGAFNVGSIARARNKQAMSAPKQKFSAQQFGDIAGKVKMEDIKKVTKLGGPLEEIGAMNLVDFRRMGKDPQEAISKIMGMFELLEEDGFGKRLAGVKAWRNSPINKLYLNLGRESIVQKKNIKEIVQKRQKENREYLSPEEFNAIMELNSKLRY